MCQVLHDDEISYCYHSSYSLYLSAGSREKRKKAREKSSNSKKRAMPTSVYVCMRAKEGVTEGEGKNEQRMYILHINIENRACSTLLFAI